MGPTGPRFRANTCTRTPLARLELLEPRFGWSGRAECTGGARAAHALYDDESVGETLTETAVEWIGEREEQFDVLAIVR